MRKELKQYDSWVGEWIGEGESHDEVEVRTYMRIDPALSGQVLVIHVRSFEKASLKLLHGVVSIVGVSPDGKMRLNTYSTVHGNILMDMPPEDPGAMAAHGVSVGGSGVIVSLIQLSDDELQLTSYWGKGPITTEDYEGKSHAVVRRVTV